jgi:hypothetical protein
MYAPAAVKNSARLQDRMKVTMTELIQVEVSRPPTWRPVWLKVGLPRGDKSHELKHLMQRLDLNHRFFAATPRVFTGKVK